MKMEESELSLGLGVAARRCALKPEKRGAAADRNARALKIAASDPEFGILEAGAGGPREKRKGPRRLAAFGEPNRTPQRGGGGQRAERPVNEGARSPRLSRPAPS